MVDETHEGYESHDEGEYHFSDEQGYDAEPESAPVAAPTEATSSNEKMKDIFQKYKRIIIGVPVFIIVVFIVYKFLLPSPSAVPVGEIKNTATVPTKNMSAQAPRPQPQAAPPAAMQPAAQAPVFPAEQPGPVPTQPTVPQEAAPMAAAPAPMGVPVPAPVATTPEDKVTALAEQNAKILAMLQDQYSQRMSAYEEQAKESQSKIDALNTRVAALESSINQMTQMMQSTRQVSTGGAGRAHTARLHYTVQAIIPGRAWLKSDSGETVTVAEGEMLRNAGRIIKIDPYEGVVEIDVGNKVVALSYGGNGD